MKWSLTAMALDYVLSASKQWLHRTRVVKESTLSLYIVYSIWTVDLSSPHLLDTTQQERIMLAVGA